MQTSSGMNDRWLSAKRFTLSATAIFDHRSSSEEQWEWRETTVTIGSHNRNGSSNHKDTDKSLKTHLEKGLFSGENQYVCAHLSFVAPEKKRTHDWTHVSSGIPTQIPHFALLPCRCCKCRCKLCPGPNLAPKSSRRLGCSVVMWHLNLRGRAGGGSPTEPTAVQKLEPHLWMGLMLHYTAIRKKLSCALHKILLCSYNLICMYTLRHWRNGKKTWTLLLQLVTLHLPQTAKGHSHIYQARWCVTTKTPDYPTEHGTGEPRLHRTDDLSGFLCMKQKRNITGGEMFQASLAPNY